MDITRSHALYRDARTGALDTYSRFQTRLMLHLLLFTFISFLGAPQQYHHTKGTERGYECG